MLRIAIVVSTFPPYRGGMGNVAATHARLLAAAGHDVTVYVPRVSLGATVESVAGYRLEALPAIFSSGNAAFIPKIAWSVRAADVVILHYPFFGGVETFALKKRSPGQRFVIYYHMDAIGHGWMKPIFSFHRRLFLGRLLCRSDLVLTSSYDYAHASFLRPYLSSLKGRLHEVPLAVDGQRFSPGPKPDDLLASYTLKRTDPIALFVGSLDRAHYFKGVPVLLKAWQHLAETVTDAHLFVVGDGDARRDYIGLAQRLGLQEVVTFTGEVEDNRLPIYYRMADLVVLPAIDRSEAFGLVLLEAMASGRGVVASNLPGVRSVVREGETGELVPPGDAPALAEVLGRLLGNASALAALGERGRILAEQEYSEAKLLQRLERCLSSLT